MKSELIKIEVVDVKRVKFFIPECMEHALVSYGRTLGKDFIKPFFACWYFELELNREKISKLGDCIVEMNDVFEEYEKYCGAYINYIDVYDIAVLMDVIKENTKNRIPTLFHLDTYYSEWGFLYGVEHSNHIVIAVGVNEEENRVCIVDPDFSDEPFWIEYNLLKKASNFYIDIKINNENEVTYDELLEIICSKRKKYEKQFEDIEKFSTVFNEYFDPNIEFGNANDIDKVLSSKLIERIREIIKGRNLFIVFLEQLASKNDYINDVIEYMYMSIGKWNTIMNLLFKAARTRWNEDFNDKICNILISIAGIEKEAYEFIYKGRRCSEKNSLENFKQTTMLICKNIDIYSECNNKGFCYEESEKCDLTGAGEYIQLSNEIENIIYNDIQFTTYFAREKDNIVCQGQMINISMEYLYSVEMLVCAEWGMCEDSLILYFEDGEYAIKKIVANDISDITEENMILVGLSKSIAGEVVNEKVGITYNKIVIDMTKRISSIKLPINPNMHIISIVALCKEDNN